MHNQTLRWILIVPITLVTSFIWMFILMQVSKIFMGIPSDATQINFWFALAGASIAFVWVLTSYIIAPNRKVQATWVSFLIGALFVAVILYPNYKYFKINAWSIAFLFAITSGGLLALYLQYKK